MLGMLPGGVLELVAAALGASLGGLLGLSLGWVLAITIEAIFMFHTVYTTLRSSNSTLQVAEPINCRETEAIWLVDTISLATILPICSVEVQIAYSNNKETKSTRSIQSTEINFYRSKSALRPNRLVRYSPYKELGSDS